MHLNTILPNYLVLLNYTISDQNTATKFSAGELLTRILGLAFDILKMIYISTQYLALCSFKVIHIILAKY